MSNIKHEHANDINEILKDVVDKLSNYNEGILDYIFKSTTLTNIFLKHDELKKLLFNYIATTKNKTYYEILDYLKKDNIESYNLFMFNNGKFTNIDLNQLDKTDEGKKMLNTILIFNTKKTTNEEFNMIFDFIKDFDIMDFEFNEVFNEILLNNIHNGYNFNFMKIYEHNETFKTKYNNLNKLSNKFYIKYDKLKYMDNYILKFNDDSLLFKKWFYILLSYVNNKKDLSFKQLLNIFQNFNILFYHKLIYPNDETSNLITFLYFKDNSEETPKIPPEVSPNISNYKPNLRYTYNIPGKDHKDKVLFLMNLENKNNFKEFETEIVTDNKGIYISTKNYKQNDIFKHCQDLINLKRYDTLLYYIFNSQFLNRSTCLFGYFIYYYFTKNILKHQYFDIIGIINDFTTFKEILEDKNNFEHVEELEEIKKISLDMIINLIN